MIGQTVVVNDAPYIVKSYLGKGKSGYSYLINGADGSYVLKAMHDEPCEYYRFGDKLRSEIEAYDFLRSTGIAIPRLVDVNEGRRYLVKEFIEGATAASLIADGMMTDLEIRKMHGLAHKAYSYGINIDYFPTNYIITVDRIVYIDYELNRYSDEWNFENWGIYYWLNSDGMRRYIQTGDILNLNINAESGIPIKEPFKTKADNICKYLGQ